MKYTVTTCLSSVNGKAINLTDGQTAEQQLDKLRNKTLRGQINFSLLRYIHVHVYV